MAKQPAYRVSWGYALSCPKLAQACYVLPTSLHVLLSPRQCPLLNHQRSERFTEACHILSLLLYRCWEPQGPRARATPFLISYWSALDARPLTCSSAHRLWSYLWPWKKANRILHKPILLCSLGQPSWGQQPLRTVLKHPSVPWVTQSTTGGVGCQWSLPPPTHLGWAFQTHPALHCWRFRLHNSLLLRVVLCIVGCLTALLYPVDGPFIVLTKNVSWHCQLATGKHYHLWLRINVIDAWVEIANAFKRTRNI